MNKVIKTNNSVCIEGFPTREHIKDFSKEKSSGYMYTVPAKDFYHQIDKFNLKYSPVREWLYCKWYHIKCLFGFEKSLVITNPKHIK